MKLTRTEMADGLKNLAKFAEWTRDSVGDFHRYGHMFGAVPGTNVFTFVLEDALRQRGITLAQFRAGDMTNPSQIAGPKTEGGKLNLMNFWRKHR